MISDTLVAELMDAPDRVQDLLEKSPVEQELDPTQKTLG